MFPFIPLSNYGLSKGSGINYWHLVVWRRGNRLCGWYGSAKAVFGSFEIFCSFGKMKTKGSLNWWGGLRLRKWDGTEAIPPKEPAIVEGIFCQLQSILRLCVLACSVRGLAGAFDGAFRAWILGGRGNWGERCIFFKFWKNNWWQVYCGWNLRLFNRESHEFSRIGSGFTGEFLCRFSSCFFAIAIVSTVAKGDIGFKLE